MNRMHTLCLTACFLLLAAGSIFAQTTYQLEFVGTIRFPSNSFFCGGIDTTGGSDVWGYTAPDGSEYAIMGVRDGVAFVKVPEMQVIDIVPGPEKEDCFWHRDIKTYGHYTYAVAEMTGTNEGVMIMDLQFLPDSVRFVRSYRTSFDIRSHNLSIDVQTGYAYILKQNYSGFRVVSLADPENPVDVNTVFTPDIHDVYARNDTVYVAEGYNRSFSIYDLRDKRNPILLTRVRIPIAGYVHNIWPTQDSKYAMTTEETSGKTVKMWDIRNLNNVELVGEYLGANQLAHNTHIRGDLAVISHYAYGVALVDVSDPAHLVELDRFDTYPRDDDPGFRGCWGAYPFTQNNYIYASNLDGKLTVLRLKELTLGVEETKTPSPQGYGLSQNYPNPFGRVPFNLATTIQYHLTEKGRVNLTIINALGQNVRTLVDADLAPGKHSIEWNGRDGAANPLPSGTYFYRLTVTAEHPYQITKKITLLR